VIEALLESVGEEGTIMMPTQSWKNLDPEAGDTLGRAKRMVADHSGANGLHTIKILHRPILWEQWQKCSENGREHCVATIRHVP